MGKGARLVLGAIVLLSAGTGSLHAAEAFRSEAELVKAMMPTVVDVYNRRLASEPEENSASSPPPAIRDEVGSGFIVDDSGIIATNRHVIEGAYAIYVTLSDGTHVPAKLVGKALDFDLALIKVDVGRPLPVAKLGDSDTLELGQHVVAIGNPWAYAGSVSSGIISAFHRQIGLSGYDDLIQSDGPINQGNSGGPLFNMSGEVIGINQALFTRNGGGSIGIGFSIPINEARFFFDSVKKYGYLRIGYLGVQGQTFTAGMAATMHLPEGGGVILSDVVTGSPADKAGLQVGDVIRRIGDTRIATTSALLRTVARSADQTVPVSIDRDRKPMIVQVAIAEAPKDLWSSQMPPMPNIRSVADLGLTLAEAPDKGGLLVSSVVDRSIAWTAGVRPGDVIKKLQAADIRSSDDIVRTIQDRLARGVRGGVTLLLDGPRGKRWVEFSVLE